MHMMGVWRSDAWPLPRGIDRTLHLAPAGALADGPSQTGEVATLAYNPGVGTTFGLFGGSSAVPLLPGDQRLEDASCSLSWTAAPLAEAVEILGLPRVSVRVSVTTDVATLVARLIDVAPDGAAALVTKGVLNLTHREFHWAIRRPSSPDVSTT